MKFKREHKTWFSTILLGVYLFVALFSQNFHEHRSNDYFKKFNFKKVEKSVSLSDLEHQFDQCLSCHFLHEGKVFFGENFSFEFQFIEDFQQENFGQDSSFYTTQLFHFYLRGPPNSLV